MTTVAIVWCFSTAAFAVEPGEMLKDPTLEARARALSAGLRCLVCQNQSIDESEAPLAKDLRLLIRERLAAGDSDAQATDFVVSRYGEFVLLKPRFEARTLLLWAGPFVLVAVAGSVLWARRRRIGGAAEAELRAEERAKLEALPSPLREKAGPQLPP